MLFVLLQIIYENKICRYNPYYNIKQMYFYIMSAIEIASHGK